jgi:hypothetical protein
VPSLDARSARLPFSLDPRMAFTGRIQSTVDPVAKRKRIEYVIAATVIWVAIWAATAGVDDDFDEMLPILGGGTFFFIVVIPAALFREHC